MFGSNLVNNGQTVNTGQTRSTDGSTGDLGVPSSKSLSLVNNRIIGRIFNIVDVDDAWNLVGCLDTHFKICIYIVLFHYSCCCIWFQNLVIDSLEME
ncbi:hypothetical protein Hdeb2414_s0004g00119801 [Helianthus debilis subsp. tardiflorus]